MPKHSSPFPDTPHGPAGHFALNLYAAVYQLLWHAPRMRGADDDLDALFEAHPFLIAYMVELCDALPDGTAWEHGAQWWAGALERWERAQDGHLPARALRTELGLSRAQWLVIMLAGLVEEDARFGQLFASLQPTVANRRPSLGLLGDLVRDPNATAPDDIWTVCRPLLQAGLLETPEPHAPRTEWLVRVPPLVWDALRGQFVDGDADLAAIGKLTPHARCVPVATLPVEAAEKARLQEAARLVARQDASLIVARGPHGSPVDVHLGAVAHALGRGILHIDGANLKQPGARDHLGPVCTALGVMPVIEYELSPGQSATPPALAGYRGPTGVCLGLEGGLSSDERRPIVTLELVLPDAAQRKRHWTRALGRHAGDELPAISRTFHLAGAMIDRAAKTAIVGAALEGRQLVTLRDARQACRTLNRQQLDTLAEPIEAWGTWRQLVCAQATTAKLRELEHRCRHREAVLGKLGPAFGSQHQRGVRALLTGPSGTGKTVAARVLASELGMDLYRVDLASVINKYVGETEKNLSRVLGRAEALDVVLLLDEGDSLLGQRTDVRSANDRYANLETNYLLQRLESYQGIVVITTNLGEQIDQAFQRRMDVVIPFTRPEAAERLAILELHLPATHTVPRAALEQAATHCRLTGGQLRNVALLAVLLSMEEPGAEADASPVQQRHLWAALESEYRKAGAAFPLQRARPLQEDDGGLDAFEAALHANCEPLPTTPN